MGRGDHLGDLEAMVLAATLRFGDHAAHGAAIYEEVVARTGRDPTVPAVHVTLRRLEAKDLVVSRTGASSARGGRPRRFYSLTPRGMRELAHFREMWRGLWAGLEVPASDEAP